MGDSFKLAPPSFSLIDPETEPESQKFARELDRWFDWLVGAPKLPDYHEPTVDRCPHGPNWCAHAKKA